MVWCSSASGTAGQWVKPEDGVVVSLYDPADLEARVDVNQDDLPKVYVGQSVEITSRAEPKRKYAGRVFLIEPKADLVKNTVSVRVKVEPVERHLLYPDMVVAVRFLPSRHGVRRPGDRVGDGEADRGGARGRGAEAGRRVGRVRRRGEQGRAPPRRSGRAVRRDVPRPVRAVGAARSSSSRATWGSRTGTKSGSPSSRAFVAGGRGKSVSRIVEVDNVTKVYRKGTIEIRPLDGVSVDVEEAEFLSLMGPSGSGKTTLLNMIAGIDTPTSGRIVVAGEDLGGLSDGQLSQWRHAQRGLHLPDLQPRAGPDRARERRASAAPLQDVAPRPEETRRGGDAGRGHRGPGVALPPAALRRSGTARGDRARPSSPTRASSWPTSPPATSTRTRSSRSSGSSRR